MRRFRPTETGIKIKKIETWPKKKRASLQVKHLLCRLLKVTSLSQMLKTHKGLVEKRLAELVMLVKELTSLAVSCYYYH